MYNLPMLGSLGAFQLSYYDEYIHIVLKMNYYPDEVFIPLNDLTSNTKSMLVSWQQKI